MNIGWLLDRRSRTTVFRDEGQLSGAPREVASQSWARMRAPISPPPARKFTLELKLVRSGKVSNDVLETVHGPAAGAIGHRIIYFIAR
jgi:hypothetical protein